MATPTKIATGLNSVRRNWLRASLVGGLSMLAACASVAPRNPLATWEPSPNYNARKAMLIVLHFTEQQSVEQSLKTLRSQNSEGPVSAHYLIGGDGHIYQLVADEDRAWHAGAGSWGAMTDVNSASIGIELDNDGRSPFAAAQIDSLLRLLTDLTSRLHIPRNQIVGHEDIAPTRKQDPGPLFPWRQLAAAGFGRWPADISASPPASFDAWAALNQIGYSPEDRNAALKAFHHHFRGIDGGPMDATDRSILYALTR